MKWLARLLRKTAEKLDKPAAEEQYYARPLAGGWSAAQVRGTRTATALIRTISKGMGKMAETPKGYIYLGYDNKGAPLVYILSVRRPTPPEKKPKSNKGGQDG
jgi:hypothetical protein